MREWNTYIVIWLKKLQKICYTFVDNINLTVQTNLLGFEQSHIIFQERKKSV